MKKRTQSEWLSLFEAQQQSGLSLYAFCRANQLCPTNFRRRRQQLLEGSATPTPAQPSSAFVKAQLTSTHSSDATELILQGHYGRLSLPSSIAPQWLAALMNALQ